MIHDDTERTNQMMLLLLLIVALIPPHHGFVVMTPTIVNTPATTATQRTLLPPPTTSTASITTWMLSTMTTTFENGEEDEDEMRPSVGLVSPIQNITLPFYTRDDPSFVTPTLPLPITTLNDLLTLEPGQAVSTDIITVVTPHSNPSSNHHQSSFRFRIHLYPFGPRRNVLGPTSMLQSWSSKTNGFGSAYAMDSTWFTFPSRIVSFHNKNPMEKFQRYNVGLYLQYIPSHDNDDDDEMVDVSFTLRLLGGAKYALEWCSGMRFVAAPSQSQLRMGQANDFGTSLLRSDLLTSFFSSDGTNTDAGPTTSPLIQVQLDLQIHERRPPIPTATHQTDNNPKRNGNASLFTLRDIRYPNEPVDSSAVTNSSVVHDTEAVRVGRIVVPICTQLAQRPNMLALGIYPGVEYRILRIHRPPPESSVMEPFTDTTDQPLPSSRNNNIDLFYSQPGALYDLKPIYPLVKELERPWPVTVSESDIPKLCTPYQYNVISAIGSLLTAVTGLAAAFVISQCVSLYYIPSKSMDPTLQVGDVLLVEKISPKINGAYRPGDVVLFNPPVPLQEIVTRSGGTMDRRSLFVKRIAGMAGDRVTVTPTGTVQITTPDGTERPNGQRDLCDTEPIGLIKKFLPNTIQETVLPPRTVEVLGDCSSVSIDSRVWGELPTTDIVGRPIIRLWPLSKFGKIPNLPTSFERQSSPTEL